MLEAKLSVQRIYFFVHFCLFAIEKGWSRVFLCYVQHQNEIKKICKKAYLKSLNKSLLKQVQNILNCFATGKDTCVERLFRDTLKFFVKFQLLKRRSSNRFTLVLTNLPKKKKVKKEGLQQPIIRQAQMLIETNELG